MKNRQTDRIPLSPGPGTWCPGLLAICLLASVAPALDADAADCFSAPSGLAGWWPGDGSAKDIANANHGTLQGGATANTTGYVGSAFSFDGTNAYVQIPDAPALKPTNLTVEAWVQFRSLDSAGNANAGQQYIVFKQNSRSASQGMFEGYDLGKWRNGGQDVFAFRVSSSSGASAQVFSTTVISTGVWYHVAGVRGPNFLELYVNGQFQRQTNVSFAQDYGTKALCFGSSGDSLWDRKLNGILDEVSLYSRALSSGEIAAVYAAGAAGKCKAPSLTVQPQSQAAVTGSSALFTAAATGFGTLSYQWQFNGADIPSATTATLALYNVQPADAGNYRVVVTNSLGAATSAVATLTVWVPPAITAQPQSRTNVFGTDASFSVAASGTPPPAYQWQFNGGDLSGATGNSLTRSAVSFGDAGGYRVVLTNMAGAATSAVATLTVVCQSITVGPARLPSGFVGNAYNQTLTASGGFGPYTFAVTAGTLPPGLNLSSAGVLAGTPTALGTSYFTVTTWDSNGCSGSRACSLAIIEAPPFITLQPLSRTNLATTAATFTAAAGGTAPLSYQWRLNGVALTDNELVSGAGTSALTLAVVQPADAGSYTLVVSNLGGAVTSAAATLTVMVPPAIHAQPANRSVPVGTSATFTVMASGTAPLSHQWQFNGADIAGATGANLMLSDVQPANAGNYRVVVTNVVGAATSALASLTVTAPLIPPTITAQPASQEAVAGSTASFSVTASGTAPLGYQWQCNGGAIAGATGTSLTLSGVAPANAGSYTVAVTNVAGAVTSGVASLTVLVPPAITAQPARLNVEAGANVSFGVTASGTQPLSYQWLFNGANLSDGGQFNGATAATLFLNNVQPTNLGSYSVVVANVAGRATSAVATLTVIPPSGCVSFAGGVVGWWPGDGSANDIVGANSGTLQGGATASATGVVGSAFSFNGTNGYVQIADSPALRPANLTVEAWVNFSGLDSATSGTAPAGDQYIVFKQNSRTYFFEGYCLEKYRITGGDAFMFTVASASGQEVSLLSKTLVRTSVWYHVACVRGSNFTELYVNGQLEARTNVAFAQDYGSLPLYLGTSGQAYWDGKLRGLLDEVSLHNRALSSNEVAAVYAADSSGKCRAPAITAQPQSLTSVVGSTAVFTATAKGFGSLSYQWRFNGANLAGATSATLTLTNVQPSNPGSYTVVVTNSMGSVTSAAAALTVWAPPAITAQPQSRTNLVGTDASFSVTASATPPPPYEWQFNGAAIPGATGSVMQRSAVSLGDAGGYQVVVSNPAGVVTSATATLTVVGVPPVITLQPQTRTNAAGTTATFTSSAAGSAPLIYQWQFNGMDVLDNGLISGAKSGTLEIASVQPGDAGNYTLRVTNMAGVASSAAAGLTVTVPPAVNVPPTSRSVAAGGSATFSVTASGTLPLSYQWRFNGADIVGATGMCLSLGNAQLTNTGSYAVVVTNLAGSVTSAVATLAVIVAPEITLQPASLSVAVGKDVSFVAAASGTPPLSYQWTFDGGPLAGATGTVLSLGSVQPGDAGDYAVVVTNAAGSATSAPATLNVIVASACVPAAPGLVGWWPGDGNANDAVGGNNGTLQGGVTASAAGLVGSAFSFDGSSGYVQIPDSPILRPTNLTIEAWVCFTSLDSPGSGNSPPGEQYIVFKEGVNWQYFAGFALSKIRIAGGDVFAFEVDSTDGQFAEVNSQTVISVGTWYHVAGVRGPNYLQLYVNGQIEGQTNVSFAQSYGDYPLYFGTTAQPAWDHKLAGALDEVCLYNRPLSSNQIAAIYAARADGKCRAITITAQPQSRLALVGANVNFTVAASGSLPLLYHWQRNELNLANGGGVWGAHTPVLSLANVSLNDSASYRVIVTNVMGAVTSAVAVLQVATNLSPPAITNQPLSQSAPAGTNVAFTVAACGTDPLGYQWQFHGTNLVNGGHVSGANSSTLSLNAVLGGDAGSYSVVVTNSVGSATSAVANLTVTPPTDCGPAPAGLVGWWPGDGNVKDIAGTNNGTLQGGAAADAQAVVGTGFSLDGTNKYIQIPDAPALKPAELTVECWVKWNNLNTPGTSVYPGQQYIVFKQNSRMTDFEGYVLSKDRTWNDIILWEVTSASGQLVRIDSTSPVTTNVWYHLAGVRGPNYIQLYFNGRLEAQTNVSFPQDYGAWPLYFGTSGQGFYDRKLNGVIDEVALYDRALSPNEIAALYALGSAGKCKGTNGILITAQPQNQFVRPGGTATFSVAATGVTPMTFQWLFNGAAIPGATNSSFSMPSVQPANAGSYKVLVGDRTGTKTSVAAVLTIEGRPVLFNPRIAAGGTFAFTLSGTPGFSYLIEVTTNLLQWTPLTWVTNTAGQVDVTDVTAVTSFSRAYRARLSN